MYGYLLMEAVFSNWTNGEVCFAVILTYALVFFSLFATACSDNNNETYVEPILSQIEVSKLVTENNKTYVSVDGKPFPFLGAQIRLDALLNCVSN